MMMFLSIPLQVSLVVLTSRTLVKLFRILVIFSYVKDYFMVIMDNTYLVGNYLQQRSHYRQDLSVGYVKFGFESFLDYTCWLSQGCVTQARLEVHLLPNLVLTNPLPDPKRADKEIALSRVCMLSVTLIQSVNTVLHRVLSRHSAMSGLRSS